MYITGTYDVRWNNDVLNPAFGALTAGDFEVVALGYHPGTAPPPPPPTPTPTPAPITLTSLSVSPGSLTGGQPATGIASLTGPAPHGGVVVSLASSSPAATVPPSVTVGVGVTAMSFPVTTTVVSAKASVTLTAAYAGATRTATLAVNPPVPVALVSLTISPTSVNAGSNATGTVKLSGPAPAGGAVVTLTSSLPGVAAWPASVTVATGALAASFPITTASSSGNTAIAISAKYAGVTRTASLSVKKRRF